MRTRRLPLALALLAALTCRDSGGPVEQQQQDWWLNPAEPLLVGAGDVASCDSDGDEATAALLDQVSGVVFTTGDNVYPDGSATDFEQCYGPTWGRHRSRTRPVPGGHDYNSPNAEPYFTYFGAAAGESGRGYYSYDVGTWHVVALNSFIPMGSTSEQLAWLRADLAANPSRCTLAYWHVPRFSSSAVRNPVSTRSAAVWDLLYEFGVEIVLNGDEHHYERFAPQRPDGTADPVRGVRQFVVGTGGRSSYPFGPPLANSEVRETGTHGLLALRLLPGGYEWRFLPVAGRTFTDRGEGVCHDAASPPGSEQEGTP